MCTFDKFVELLLIMREESLETSLDMVSTVTKGDDNYVNEHCFLNLEYVENSAKNDAENKRMISNYAEACTIACNRCASKRQN